MRFARFLVSRLITYVLVIVIGMTIVFFVPRFLPSDTSFDPSDEKARAELSDRVRRDELFAFVAWALVHEPEALADRFAYENVMRDQGFTEHKSVFVHTAIVVARPIVTAYEGERANV